MELRKLIDTIWDMVEDVKLWRVALVLPGPRAAMHYNGTGMMSIYPLGGTYILEQNNLTMDLNKAQEARLLLNEISRINSKQTELSLLKYRIKDILKGHFEIPNQKVYNAFNALEDLSDCLSVSIEEKRNQIKEL